MPRLRGIGLLAVVFSLPALGQKPFSDLAARPAASNGQKAQAVEYLFPEQVTVAAGKPTEVDMHFRVAPGLHINSHDPIGEGMIPTTLKVPEASPVHLVRATFPPGKDFALPVAPSERLSVYTGEFTVRVVLQAPAGERLVEASLRYQACDNNACMPPRTIPVVFDVIAR